MDDYYDEIYALVASLKYKKSDESKIDAILMQEPEVIEAIAQFHRRIPEIRYNCISLDHSDHNRVIVGSAPSTQIIVISSDGIKANFTRSPRNEPYYLVNKGEEFDELFKDILLRADQNDHVRILPETPEYKKAFKNPPHCHPKNTDPRQRNLFD